MQRTNLLRWFWYFFGLTAVVLFFRLGATPIYILDEAKNAQCAREMLQRNDWVVPTFNGSLRTDKPALHYWFMMLSYKMFGVHEWSARLFSVLMGLATIAITFFYTRRFTNTATAFFSALALMLSTHFLFEFRLSVPDPYLIFFTTLGLFAAFDYLERKNWAAILLAALALALATLAKGPVALGLPGLVLLAFLIINKRIKEILDIKLLVAAVLYAAIALPWYLKVHAATSGAFTKGFFFEHNLNRFSSEMEGHGGLFIITPIIVFVGMLPLAVFIFSALKKKYEGWRQPFVQFSMLVVAVYVVFFSISSTKLPNYPMPCYPFVAIVLGWWLQQLWKAKARLPLYGIIVLLVIGFAIPVTGFLVLGANSSVADLAWISLFLVVLPFGLLMALLSQVKNSLVRTVLSLSVTYFIFNALFIAVAYPTLYGRNPVQMTQGITAGKKLVAYKSYNPAFNFYYTGTITVYNSADSLKMACRPGWIVITRKEAAAELDSMYFDVLAAHPDLFELPTTVLLSLKKNK